jgi:molybdenum cofactor guanylyltransferase
VKMSGLVLAGGRSRRMGLDKALLVMDGERLVDRAVRKLSGICDDVMVAAGPHRPLRILGTRQVADAEPGVGPLGALIGGLEVARHDLVAVLAVDHTDADPAVFTALAARWDGRTAGVVPEVDGRVQPLHAVWARNAAADLRALLAGRDRSLRQVFDKLDVAVVGPAVWGELDPAGAFARNVNSFDDLR